MFGKGSVVLPVVLGVLAFMPGLWSWVFISHLVPVVRLALLGACVVTAVLAVRWRRSGARSAQSQMVSEGGVAR